MRGAAFLATTAAALAGQTPSLPHAASGWCTACGQQHSLPRTPEAEMEACALLSQIDKHRRFDLFGPDADDDARFKTDSMTSGKMLGVLLCQDGSLLRAFSGLLGGTAHCPGWAGPVSVPLESSLAYSSRFSQILEHVRAAAVSAEPPRSEHRRIHRALSAELSTELEERVVLRNARGLRARLVDVLQDTKVPGGVGDCAAPKLLIEAYERGLTPAAMAEVWYEAPVRRSTKQHGVLDGVQHRVTTRRIGRARREHGSFHPACEERCKPIMGFLLCGLGQAHGTTQHDDGRGADGARVCARRTNSSSGSGRFR